MQTVLVLLDDAIRNVDAAVTIAGEDHDVATAIGIRLSGLRALRTQLKQLPHEPTAEDLNRATAMDWLRQLLQTVAQFRVIENQQSDILPAEAINPFVDLTGGKAKQ